MELKTTKERRREAIESGEKEKMRERESK